MPVDPRLTDCEPAPVLNDKVPLAAFVSVALNRTVTAQEAETAKELVQVVDTKL
jgi:hypothetical protein